MTEVELAQFEKRNWNELAPDLQEKSITHLCSLPKDLLQEVSDAISKYGSNWMDKIHADTPFYSFHFCEGMGIRNYLRQIISDDELPTGNWDDYYVPALEQTVMSSK